MIYLINDKKEDIYFQVTALFPRIIVRFFWGKDEKYLLKNFETKSDFKSAYANLNINNNRLIKKNYARELWKLLLVDEFKIVDFSD